MGNQEIIYTYNMIINKLNISWKRNCCSILRFFFFITKKSRSHRNEFRRLISQPRAKHECTYVCTYEWLRKHIYNKEKYICTFCTCHTYKHMYEYINLFISFCSLAVVVLLFKLLNISKFYYMHSFYLDFNGNRNETSLQVQKMNQKLNEIRLSENMPIVIFKNKFAP